MGINIAGVKLINSEWFSDWIDGGMNRMGLSAI